MPSDLVSSLANMPPAELAALRQRVEAERKKRDSRRQFWTYYPDTGPLRRELYGKHLEFFRLGASHNERAFIGANRCLTYETLIDLADGSRMPVGVLVERGEPFTVLAWDGEQLVPRTVTQTFRKPAEMCYRVMLASGLWFEASAQHQILLDDGAYASVSRLAACAPSPLASNSDSDQSARVSGGWRWSQKLRDCLDGYSAGLRRGGVQLLLGAGSARAWPPSQACAQTLYASASCTGDLLPKGSGSLLDSLRHLSIRDGQGHRAGRFAVFLARVLRSGVRSYSATRREDQQSSTVAASPLQRGGEGVSGRYRDGAPFSPCIGDNSIVSISAIGIKEIFDFTVPYFHNYLAAGCIHHNSGKSHCAAYEVTAHLTGRYPPWWEGFRFTEPNEWWAAGVDSKAVRDTIQHKLLGKFGQWGTGMIPFEDIIGKPTAGGVPESVDTIRLRWYDANGKEQGISVAGFKNYEQDRESFQGTQKNCWCDEEPPATIYSECLARTLSTTPGKPNGLMLCTFTPLLGISDVVKSFMPMLGTQVQEPPR